MDEVERYWRSSEALEPVFKYLGLRKRLGLIRINTLFQEIVCSWLRRCQRKLVILTQIPRDGFKQFVPGCTLLLALENSEKLSKFMENCPKLSSLYIEDDRVLSSLLATARSRIPSDSAMSTSDIILDSATDAQSLNYENCVALMDLMPNLTKIAVTTVEHQQKLLSLS